MYVCVCMIVCVYIEIKMKNRTITMANSIRSALLALCLLFLATADGRTMKQAHFDNTTSSTTASLDSTNSPPTTNSNDVEGLGILIERFPALSGDQFPHLSNDPCYPQDHQLVWIACSNDDVRRVTALFLGAQNLYGYLPDFSSMDALQIIDLHRNSLYGSIPEFLGTFPELTYLDLSSNFFDGALPTSLANNKKVELNLAGNSLQLPPPATVVFAPPFPNGEILIPPPSGSCSCGPTSPDKPDRRRRRKKKKMKMSRLRRILRITIPTFSVAAVGGGGYAIWYHYRRRRRKKDDDHKNTHIESEPTTTSSSDSTPTPTPTSTCTGGSSPSRRPPCSGGTLPPVWLHPFPERPPCSGGCLPPVWLPPFPERPPCSGGILWPEWPCRCTRTTLAPEWPPDHVFRLNFDYS